MSRLHVSALAVSTIIILAVVAVVVMCQSGTPDSPASSGLVATTEPAIPDPLPEGWKLKWPASPPPDSKAQAWLDSLLSCGDNNGREVVLEQVRVQEEFRSLAAPVQIPEGGLIGVTWNLTPQPISSDLVLGIADDQTRIWCTPAESAVLLGVKAGEAEQETLLVPVRGSLTIRASVILPEEGTVALCVQDLPVLGVLQAVKAE